MSIMNELINPTRLMDRRFPFWQHEIDSILSNVQMPPGSTSSLFDTPVNFDLTLTLTLHKFLLLEKDSRIRLHYLLSNLLLQDSFSFDYSYYYSFKLYTTSIDVYNFQSPFEVFFVSSFQKCQVLQLHQNLSCKQYAKPDSYLQFSFHGIWYQPLALVENLVELNSHPFATTVVSNQLLFLHHSTSAESLSHHEARQVVYQLFSFDSNICHIRHNVKYNIHCANKHITSVTTSPYFGELLWLNASAHPDAHVHRDSSVALLRQTLYEMPCPPFGGKTPAVLAGGR